MTTRYLAVLRGFSRNVRLYLLIGVFFGLSFMGLRLVLFNLYLLRLGYGPQAIGVINAAMGLGYALISPFAGAMGKRWGIHRVMAAGLGISVAGFLALPAAEAFSGIARSVWLVATCGSAYVGCSAFVVNGDVLIYNEAGQEGAGHALSILLAVWGLTSFAGSLVAGVLPGLVSQLLGVSVRDPAPYRYALLIAGVALAPGLLLVLLIRPGTGARRSEETGKASGPAPYGLIALLVVVQLLQGTGEGAARTFFNVYLADGLRLPTSGIGALMAVAQLLPVPVALAAPLLLARWGNVRVFVRSSLGIGLFLVPLALVRHWGAAGFGYTGIMAMAWLWRQPFVLHRLALVEPGWRPVINGVANMALGLSFSAINLAGGYVIAAWGYAAFFLVAAGLTAAGSLLFRARFAPESKSAVEPMPGA